MIMIDAGDITNSRFDEPNRVEPKSTKTCVGYSPNSCREMAILYRTSHALSNSMPFE